MMTSAIGERRGFTLVEILVVISLMTLIVTALVAATLNVGQRAYVAATQALFERIDLAAGGYKDLSGFYPPDGLDAAADGSDGTVKSREGRELRGAACLYEFLGRPLQIVKHGAGGKVVVERYDSTLLRGLRESELARVPEEGADVAEIRDSWNTPIHYDRLEGENSYSEQSTGEVHLEPPEWHPADPRSEAGVMVVDADKGQNPGKYDIWSHGRHGHDPLEADVDAKTALKETLCNWRPPKE